MDNIQTDTPKIEIKKSSKKMKVIIVAVIVLVVLLIMSMSSSPKKGSLNSLVRNDSIAMVDLSMKIQSEVGLQNVLISEVVGGILEVRANSPVGVSRSVLDNGTAFLFGYLVPQISKNMEKIRIIYTSDGVDKVLYEASVSDINDWKGNKMSDGDFAKKIKHVDLTVVKK